MGEETCPELRHTVDAFDQAMNEYAAAMSGKAEDDPDLETARRAFVRRWAELVTAGGCELPSELALLVRAMDRMDREDAANERSKRRGRRTRREGTA